MVRDIQNSVTVWIFCTVFMEI